MKKYFRPEIKVQDIETEGIMEAISIYEKPNENDQLTNEATFETDDNGLSRSVWEN